MRIASYQAYENVINNLQGRQRSLQTSQEQMTSGKRVSQPSDDPVAAARAERALAAITAANAHQRALETARTNTQLTESALGDGINLLQEARDGVMAAGNASYGPEQRAMLVQSLKGLREQLLGVSNRGDGAGGFLFGGQGASSPPFAESPTGVLYQGSAGDTKVASNESLTTSVDGANAWLEAPAAVSGDPALSLFSVLDAAIAGLGNASASGADIAASVKTGLRDIDAVMNHLSSVRATAGEALNRMDTAELRIADGKLAAKTERSNAEDLDMVEAFSDFQNQQTGYDAALRAYAQVQKLSLFNYIG